MVLPARRTIGLRCSQHTLSSRLYSPDELLQALSMHSIGTKENQIMATATLTRTDQEIAADVLSELKWDAEVQPNEIGVSVKDGVVTLTGWVDSYLKKWSAEDAAHKVTGVKAVANDIEIKLATERTDPDIAAAVVHSLEW